MTWCLLEEEWLRDGHHVYFAPEDDAGIAAFEQHLRRKRLPFVVHNRPEVPAIVFARPPKPAQATAKPRQHQAQPQQHAA